MQGTWHTLPDGLAYSLPFGAFAPAEFYDIDGMQRARRDQDYYDHLRTPADGDGVVRFGPPANILQVHVNTATPEGTLAGLNRVLTRIADKLRAGTPLTPAEQNFVGYEAIQLMPVEPTIEYELGPHFWQPLDADDAPDGICEVRLLRPDMSGWGYDVVLAASSAINPVLLESGRPDELVDLAATLHTFPEGPIKLIFDVVFGHTDNQSLHLLNQHFFRGPNMYGQDVNQEHPVVRAIMLEMQRRKVNFGADGVRVDGAQDFKTWNPQTQVVAHDDAYLEAMSAVQQQVGGVRYYPWMIFEDGRPWPREDWPVSSTYRDVIERQPDVFQWGPLTFAHNTPCLRGFWDDRWWRIEQIMQMGSHWISGCANHDTMRRCTQLDPDGPINWNLGETLPAVLNRSYDNPAATLLAYGCFPGVPMEFINATMHAPWGFIRNTDDRYALLLVSEEAGFLDWQMTPDLYAQPDVCPRLKALGFAELSGLHRLLQTLKQAVALTRYDLVTMVERLRAVAPPLPGPEITLPNLKAVCRAFMDDLREYCNAWRCAEALDPQQTAFNLAVRTFRRERPWLRADLGPGEHYGRMEQEAALLFYGLRRAPDGSEQVLFVANMEGRPASVTPTQLPIPDLVTADWEVALSAPGLNVERTDTPVTLADSQGLLLTRRMVAG